MSKPWRKLQFIKQIVIKPEDSKNPMWVTFNEESDYEDSFELSSSRRMLISRERSISLGANTMYSVEMDYPELFKKLLAATGDCHEAYDLYNALQKEVPENWEDYDKGRIW